MSDQHSWKVVRHPTGWYVEHTGRTRMRFQPDQFGMLKTIYWYENEAHPPEDPEELRGRLMKVVHARLLGKRFGDRFSNERRNVCCEYAAELNSKEA